MAGVSAEETAGRPVKSAGHPSPSAVRPVGYGEICRGIEALGNRIAASPEGWRPDAVVGVARGGLIPATHLCHRFECPLFFIYNGTLLGDLSDLAGRRRILVVDEINDTGKSLQQIRDGIFSQPAYADAEVRYAVIYTRYTTVFRADYYLDYAPFFISDDVWQHFPWEEAGPFPESRQPRPDSAQTGR